MDERTIGGNIRSLREQAGLTVTALAKQADLAKSTLSKIETGQVSAPISTLLRIAEAMALPLAEFFSEPQSDPTYVLTRKGEGPIITRDGSRFGYAYQALAPEMRRKRAEPFLLTVQPGDPVGQFRHGGQEFIYMLAGRLAFTVGEHEMTLRPGDSLYFDPHQTHTTRVVSKTPARFLCLFIQDDAAPRHTERVGRRPRSRA